jgi:hypothetical protein
MSSNLKIGEKYISEYFIDISELPLSTVDIRIPGPTADILSIIGQVASELAYDYYVELVPRRINGVLVKIIKFRIVSRANQPDLGIVQNYVNSITEGGVISSSYGRELRNESTTNFIIGGQKRSMYQVQNGVPLAGIDPDAGWLESNYPNNTYVKDTIVPYYGKDFNDNIFVRDNNGFITFRTEGLKESLTAIGAIIPEFLQVSVQEIAQAEYGYSVWLGFIEGQNLDLANVANQYRLKKVINDAKPAMKGAFSRASALPGSLNENVKARDLIQTINTGYKSEITRDLNKIYAFVNSMYQSSISTLMVRVPYMNAKRILTTEGTNNEIYGGRLITSDFPAPVGSTTQGFVSFSRI